MYLSKFSSVFNSTAEGGRYFLAICESCKKPAVRLMGYQGDAMCLCLEHWEEFFQEIRDHFEEDEGMEPAGEDKFGNPIFKMKEKL